MGGMKFSPLIACRKFWLVMGIELPNVASVSYDLLVTVCRSVLKVTVRWRVARLCWSILDPKVSSSVYSPFSWLPLAIIMDSTVFSGTFI